MALMKRLTKVTFEQTIDNIAEALNRKDYNYCELIIMDLRNKEHLKRNSKKFRKENANV